MIFFVLMIRRLFFSLLLCIEGREIRFSYGIIFEVGVGVCRKGKVELVYVDRIYGYRVI